jgi:hypothetical protein
MNIEVGGVKITFGNVGELNDALKRKSAELSKEIEEHETKVLSLRKIRKEVLRVLGGQPGSATPDHSPAGA